MIATLAALVLVAWLAVIVLVVIGVAVGGTILVIRHLWWRSYVRAHPRRTWNDEVAADDEIEPPPAPPRSA